MNPVIETEQTCPKPICTMTMIRAEAQALMDAYGIPQACMEQEEIQLLQKTNPDLLQARATIELLRLFGGPSRPRPWWIATDGFDVGMTEKPRSYRQVYLSLWAQGRR